MAKKLTWSILILSALFVQGFGTLSFKENTSKDHRLQEEQHQPYKLQNTTGGYREFISHYPEDILVEDAQNRIASLEFVPYEQTDTIEGYMEFKARHPDDPHCSECDTKIEQLAAATLSEQQKLAGKVQLLQEQNSSPAALDGTEIMTTVSNRNRVEDYTITTLWTLTKEGRKKHTTTYMEKRKNFSSTEDFFYKSVIRYIDPPDYYGTAILTWDYRDNKRLFWTLRFRRNVRKAERDIAPELLRPPAEADFSLADYYDINVGEEKHQLLRSEMLEDTKCFVVESTPINTDLKYGKRIIWVDQKNFIPLKIEYFDKKDVPWKNLAITWQKKYGLWFWRKAEVTNLQKAYKTFITITDIRANIGLPDRDFTRNSLETKILGF